MSEQLFLAQVYDDGQFFIYAWTPTLAKKKYVVVKGEVAKLLIGMVGQKKNNTKYLEDPSILVPTDKKIKMISVEAEEDTGEEEESNPIVDEVAGDLDESPRDLDAVRDIHITQEDILAKELKFVSSCQHKSTLENHFLGKYQTEVPIDKLSTMKAIANKMLTDFAKENRLYLVDGHIQS